MRVGFVAFLPFAVCLGCSGDDDMVPRDAGAMCYPGSTLDCDCPTTGSTSWRTCNASGDAYGPCECPACTPGCCFGPRLSTTEGTYDSCTGNDLCVCADPNSFCEQDGTCTDAYGLTYALSAIGGIVAARDPMGDFWDSGACTGPDVYFTVELNGVLMMTDSGMPRSAVLDCIPLRFTGDGTYYIPGTDFDPASTFTLTLAEGDRVALTVRDDDGDPASDPIVVGCEVAVSGELLRNRQILCDAGTGTYANGYLWPAL